MALLELGGWYFSPDSTTITSYNTVNNEQCNYVNSISNCAYTSRCQPDSLRQHAFGVAVVTARTDAEYQLLDSKQQQLLRQ